MSWDNYKPTKSEQRAIEAAYEAIEAVCTHSDARSLASFVEQERRGYGVASQRLPLIGAKALMVRWFLEGMANPDTLLCNVYSQRPASIWAQGAGANYAPKVNINKLDTLRLAVASHRAAFDRMIAAN